jgi:hypothetical protein
LRSAASLEAQLSRFPGNGFKRQTKTDLAIVGVLKVQIQTCVGTIEFDVRKGVVKVIEIQFDFSVTDIRTHKPG